MTEHRDGPTKRRPGRPESAEMQALRRRAYEELGIAVDEGGSELPVDWLAANDPDLASLRSLDEPAWQRLLKRHGSAPRVQRARGVQRRVPRPSVRKVLEPYLDGRSQAGLPEPAWGDPRRRRNDWLALVMAVLAAAAVVAVLSGTGWIVGLVAALLAIGVTVAVFRVHDRWLIALPLTFIAVTGAIVIIAGWGKTLVIVVLIVLLAALTWRAELAERDARRLSAEIARGVEASRDVPAQNPDHGPEGRQ